MIFAMTEDSNSGNEQPETFTEQRLDMEELLGDFADYLGEPAVESSKSRGDRLAVNVMHMFLTLVTAGAYLFVYLGYYVYKFFKQNPLETYKVTVEVEVQKSEDESHEEEEE